MSRSSFKGYFFCRKTLQAAYKRRTRLEPTVRYSSRRASTLPNSFVNMVGGVEVGRTSVKFVLRPTSATFKGGMFAFTRKPYFFPVKKRHKVK